MVPVSIRLRQDEIDEIDKAAAEVARKTGRAWSRTDVIRERMQSPGIAIHTNEEVSVSREILTELRAIRAMLKGGRR
jgi:cysteinyl-tRNA synthetase